MIKFDNFHYIYPPRPKNPISPTELDFWDNGMMIGQPKLNGSNAVIFTDGNSVYIYNRHNQRMSNVQLEKEEILNIYSGRGWMVINGEYMNKSKNDERGQVFNHKLVIFDILVHDGQYLLGTTFKERIGLLDSLYGTRKSDKEYLTEISENIYRVKSYDTGFKTLYEDLTKIDMVEGLVLKRKSGKLELGTTENNNTKSQIKVRKSTKNYKY